MSELQKKNAGYAAVELLRDGQAVGVGTGSTVKYVIHAWAEARRQEREGYGLS